MATAQDVDALTAIEAAAALLDVAEELLKDDPHPSRAGAAMCVRRAHYDVFGALGEMVLGLGMYSEYVAAKGREYRKERRRKEQ